MEARPRRSMTGSLNVVITGGGDGWPKAGWDVPITTDVHEWRSRPAGTLLEPCHNANRSVEIRSSTALPYGSSGASDEHSMQSAGIDRPSGGQRFRSNASGRTLKRLDARRKWQGVHPRRRIDAMQVADDREGGCDRDGKGGARCRRCVTGEQGCEDMVKARRRGVVGLTWWDNASACRSRSNSPRCMGMATPPEEPVSGGGTTGEAYDRRGGSDRHRQSCGNGLRGDVRDRRWNNPVARQIQRGDRMSPRTPPNAHAVHDG